MSRVYCCSYTNGHRLRTDGAHSDFTLVAGSKEWKVHKIVLSMHSDVLYKMSISENFVVRLNADI